MGSSSSAAVVDPRVCNGAVVTDSVNLLRELERKYRRIPQHSLTQITPGEDKYPAIRDEEIRRFSPFIFRHRDERYTITGIACLPLSTEIQSPEAEVVAGGVNESYVAIRLTPEEEGQYGCRIIITGKERQPHRRQRPDVVDLLRQTNGGIGGIFQPVLVEEISDGNKYPTIFITKLHRRSEFKFKYSDERYTITGIAFLPESTEIQSPEAEVVEGGVNHSYVVIRLKPEKDYEYGCQIIISGKERELRRLQSTTEPNEETQNSAVPKVAVSLPPFWPDHPASWFAKAEAQFELAGITCQRTKYNYVVSQLNQQEAAEVEDIITSPPEHESYDRLKAELIRRLSTSRTQRVAHFLLQQEMGDRKPSQFLRHLRGLAPDVTDDFLRPTWASGLPPDVQAMLVGETKCYLDSAAHLADEFYEVTPQPTTASVSPATPNGTAVLLELIAELSPQGISLGASQTHSRSQSSDPHHSHSRDHRRSTPMRSPTPHDVCWYHWNFGNNARKCIPPCSHQQKDYRQQEHTMRR